MENVISPNNNVQLENFKNDFCWQFTNIRPNKIVGGKKVLHYIVGMG